MHRSGLDCLSHQRLSDLAATQRRRDFCVVDVDQPVAGTAVGHLGFDAVDDQSVTSLDAPSSRSIVPSPAAGESFGRSASGVRTGNPISILDSGLRK